MADLQNDAEGSSGRTSGRVRKTACLHPSYRTVRFFM